MKLSKIRFSRWVKWVDRKGIPKCNLPGIYLLARFNRPQKGEADPIDKSVIYIGETCDNSLHGRWLQFGRAAFQGKFGHSGGLSYYETFGDTGSDLYVAAFSDEDIPENLRHLYIRYVERKLIFEYAVRHGAPPVLNRK